MDEGKVLLVDVVRMCQDFLDGKITKEQLDVWGTGITIRSYIPIMEKMLIMMDIVQNSEYSIFDSQEIKTVEFYKNLFFKCLLKYTDINIDDKKLYTFENYDLIYPILSDFILQYCKNDYELVISMIKDSINFYNIKETNDNLKSINIESVEQNTKINKKLINELSNNKDMVSDLNNIMNFNDPMTKKVVESLKEESLKQLKDSKKINKTKGKTKSKIVKIEELNK